MKTFNENMEMPKTMAAVNVAGTLVVAAIHHGIALGGEIKECEIEEQYDSAWIPRIIETELNFVSPEVWVSGMVAAIIEGNSWYCGDSVAVSLKGVYALVAPDRRRQLEYINSCDLVAVCDTAIRILNENVGFFNWVRKNLLLNGFVTKREVGDYLARNLMIEIGNR